MSASSIDDLFGQVAGLRIAGGCDDCDAYQETEMDEPGCWLIHVFHDEGCPTLARHQRRPA